MASQSAAVELFALIAKHGINTSNRADYLRYLEAALTLFQDDPVSGITAAERYADQASWDAANAATTRQAGTRTFPPGPPPVIVGTVAAQQAATENHKWQQLVRVSELGGDSRNNQTLLGTMSSEMLAVAKGLDVTMVGLKIWTIFERIRTASLLALSNSEATEIKNRLDYTQDPEEHILMYRDRMFRDTGTLANAGRLNGWEATSIFFKSKFDKIPGGAALFEKYIEQPHIRTINAFTAISLFDFLEPIWADRPRTPPVTPAVTLLAAHPAAAAAAAAAPLPIGLVASGQAPRRFVSTVANRLSIANGSNSPSPLKPARAHANYCFLHGWTGPKGHIGTACNDLHNDGNATAAMKAATAPATLNAKDKVTYVGSVKVF